MSIIKLLALTVNTRESPNLEIWRRSAERYGYPYEIIGMGEEWKGWPWRTKKYINAIHKHPEIDIFILCDSDDLYFVDHSSEFIKKFLEFQSSIIIGTEGNCCTGTYEYEEIKDMKSKLKSISEKKQNQTRYFYLNGGCVCGYRNELLELLNDNKDSHDDQTGYIELFIKDPDRITPDYYHDIIGTFQQSILDKKVTEWEIDSNNKIHNNITKSYPVIMHFPAKNYNNYKFFLHEDDKNFNFNIRFFLYSTIRNISDNFSYIFVFLILIIICFLIYKLNN